MSTFFVDTGALVKRYIAEIGSPWVLTWIEPTAGNVTVISELATVEIFSSLSRRGREGLLSPKDLQVLQSDFLVHVETEYLTVPLDLMVLAQARTLVNKHPLRALDAVQLACALRATSVLNEPMSFISGDNNLLKVAAAEGFTTDNPNAYP